jgi:hypothetical protein
VGPDASLEEIHEAYRAKSKKHHPDAGGDEWAFRMVARAYEVLKTTAAKPWARPRANVADPNRSATWAWTRSAQFDTDSSSGVWGAATANGAETVAESDEADGMSSTTSGGTSPGVDPDKIRTVDVELIWTRFEKDGPTRLMSDREADDMTLSVCTVIAWPPTDLVDRTAELPSAAEVLRTLIDHFERLRGQQGVVAARSRIEDGRFVGWLSYPDVLTAQDAFFQLRDTLRNRGLTVKLQTRDERVPFDWYGPDDPPVITGAS